MKSKVIAFKDVRRRQTPPPTKPQPPENTPAPGCVRPSLYVLDSNRDKIIHALKQRRDRRSIAAQYGLRMSELFDLVADVAAERRKAA